MTTTIIELLRHGEVEGGDIFRGSTDVQLSSKGWEQMLSAIKKSESWDTVISSPLQRCQYFSNELNNQTTANIMSDKRLQEIDFGDWEGCTGDSILKSDAALLQRWWDSPTQITPPNGESFQQFRCRVLECWQEIINNHQGKTLLLVTHAGVIRIILMKILGMQEENLFRLDVAYASLTKIRIHHDETGDWATLLSHG